MNEQSKRNWKQELKDVWNEYKVPLKVGIWCLGIGTVYGFIKGSNLQAKSTGEAFSKLLDKVPDIDRIGPGDLPFCEILEFYDEDNIVETLELMGWSVKKF